jgi:hypothetical protein
MYLALRSRLPDFLVDAPMRAFVFYVLYFIVYAATDTKGKEKQRCQLQQLC